MTPNNNVTYRHKQSVPVQIIEKLLAKKRRIQAETFYTRLANGCWAEDNLQTLEKEFNRTKNNFEIKHDFAVKYYSVFERSQVSKTSIRYLVAIKNIDTASNPFEMAVVFIEV